MAITGGGLTGGDGSGGGITDNVTDTHIPVKLSGAFEDSPLTWSGVPGENIISSETIEVPPGTIQVGEGLSISAAGVIPIFRSLLTGIQYIPPLFIYDPDGLSGQPFKLVIDPPATLVVQPDFSTSTPLVGMFTNTVTSSEFITSLGVKTNASATLTGVRLQFVSQTTTEPIYYFPSKAAWEADEGEDLTADGAGDVVIDLSEAPLGLLAGEVIDVNYKIDSGVLLGTGTIPYQEVVRQVATFIDMVSVDSSVTVLSDVTDAGSGAIITAAERTKLGNQSGTNTGDVTLATDDTTQETLDLTGQEISVDLVTTTTDGAMSADDKLKLDGVETGAEVNVQSDWNQTNTGADDYIKNKPDIDDENCGAGYFISEVSTYCASSSSWYKIVATFTPQVEQNLEWDGTNKRWNYTGTGAAVSIFTTFTGEHGDGSSRTVQWEFRVNGAQLPNPGKLARIEAYDPMSLSLMVPYVELATNDYIELYTKIDLGGETVKTSKMNLLIR